MTLLFLSRGLQSQYHSERGIAANMEMTDLSTLFHLLTDDSNTCNRTTLIGTNVTTLLQPKPSPVRVTLQLSPSVSLAAGQPIGSIRKIEQSNLVSLTETGNPNSYIATLSFETSVIGKALTVRSPHRQFFLPVAVDPNSNTITSCGGGASTPPTSTMETTLVIHGQSQNPTCPNGWSELWNGYSFAGGGSGNDIASSAFQDLGSTGSCLQNFYPVPYFESQAVDPTVGFYIDGPHTNSGGGMPRTAFTMWLYANTSDRRAQPQPSNSNYGYGPSKATHVSRCAVCSKPAPVLVLHSQTTLVPSCPNGWTPLWTGYSFVGMTSADSNNVGNLGSTGSCLREFMPVPFLECGANDKHQNIGYGDYCHYGQTFDYAAWMTASYLGRSSQNLSATTIDRHVGRCSVCTK